MNASTWGPRPSALLGLALVLGLASVHCHDSKDSSNKGPKDAPQAHMALPEGLWAGKFQSEVTHKQYAAAGAVAPDGEARFYLVNDSLMKAKLKDGAGKGKAFAAAGATLPDKSGLADADFTIRAVTPKGSFQGGFSGGGDRGTFTLLYNQAYEQPASLAKITGAWKSAASSSGHPVTLTVGADGSLKGEDSLGTFLGNAVPDPRTGLFRVKVTVTPKGAAAREPIEGFAWLDEVRTPELNVHVSNDVQGFAAVFERK